MRRRLLSLSCWTVSALLLAAAAGMEPVAGAPERTPPPAGPRPSLELTVTQEPAPAVLACEEREY